MKIDEVRNKFVEWGIKPYDKGDWENLDKMFKNAVKAESGKYLISNIDITKPTPQELVSQIKPATGRRGNDYPEELVDQLFANPNFQALMLKRIASQGSEQGILTFVKHIQEQTQRDVNKLMEAQLDILEKQLFASQYALQKSNAEPVSMEEIINAYNEVKANEKR